MLTIKRVATVLSNYQEEDAAEPQLGCGRNCLGECCLPVCKLPLYAFKSSLEIVNSPSTYQRELPNDFFLHTLLLGQWEDRLNRGLFRYDVTICETKVIPSKYCFIAQINEGRHLKKRPTEFRVDQVLQPFDHKKFNFTKIGQEEVLFCFEAGNSDQSQFFEQAPGGKAPNVVAINVSPIDYGHVLLIPRVLDCLPQRIDHESFLLAVHMASEAGSPFFRVGYNSLGAFATINHLHFQAYYLSMPFPVERAPKQQISAASSMESSGMKVFRLLDYPVRALVYEVENSLNSLSDVVANACIWLQNNNIPFNVLISDLGRKVFLFPQCYAQKQALGEVSQELLDTLVNPAVWEISGHMVLKQMEDYVGATEESVWRLLAEVSLSEERFLEVMACIFEATGMLEAVEEEMDTDDEEDASFQTVDSTNFGEDSLFLQ